jgi:hypothetical protein
MSNVRELKIELERGLYIVRYQTADNNLSPPSVRVICQPPSNSVVYHPDRRDSMLREPGAAVIVRSVSSSTLVVHITNQEASGELTVEVAVETLDNP